MSDPCPGCTVCDRDPQLGDQLNLSELQYPSRSYLTRSSLSSGFLDGNSLSYTSIFNISAISTAESNEESRYETASDDSGIGL
uniref:Uncharacterized protein n=1 Tax=Acrobeloides nanus TaxID=290746 RepID=A0A914D832_9BILA